MATNTTSWHLAVPTSVDGLLPSHRPPPPPSYPQATVGPPSTCTQPNPILKAPPPAPSHCPPPRHSSSPAIFEHDIKMLVPRAKGTEALEQSVPSVLDSAAAILGFLPGDSDGLSTGEHVAVVAGARTGARAAGQHRRGVGAPGAGHGHGGAAGGAGGCGAGHGRGGRVWNEGGAGGGRESVKRLAPSTPWSALFRVLVVMYSAPFRRPFACFCLALLHLHTCRLSCLLGR